MSLTCTWRLIVAGSLVLPLLLAAGCAPADQQNVGPEVDATSEPHSGAPGPAVDGGSQAPGDVDASDKPGLPESGSKPADATAQPSSDGGDSADARPTFEGEGTAWTSAAPRAVCASGDKGDPGIQGLGGDLRCNVEVAGKVAVPHFLSLVWSPESLAGIVRKVWRA